MVHKTTIESGVEPRAFGTDYSSRIVNELDWGLEESIEPLSMADPRLLTPRWPLLVEVCLTTCRVDHSFLRVLLSNAPALEDLSIVNVVVLQAEPRVSIEDGMDCSAIQIAVGGEGYREEDRRIGAYIATSFIRTLRVYQVDGLQCAEVFYFATQLPYLADFCFGPTEGSVQGSPLCENQLLSDIGFYRLQSLCLYKTSCIDTAFMVRRVSRGLLVLRIFQSPPHRSLVQSFTPAHSRTLRVVFISQCTLIESSEVFHFILCTLHGLVQFGVFKTPLVCDPRILEQTPWVCKDLQMLVIVPNCRGSSNYSASEAQHAFLTQVGFLVKLNALILTDSNEDSLANGFTPEKSLQLLSNLTELKVTDLGFSTGAQLSARDARMMIRWWPSLAELYSINPEGNKSFMAYMGTHRPKIELRDHTRY